MATETLRPNAAGDEENINNVVGDGAGTHYTTVDEASPDDATTYVDTNSSTFLRDLYNLPAHSVGGGTINFIRVYARCRDSSATLAGRFKIAIKTGGTAYESGEISPPDTNWNTYSNQWDTNLKTGVAWTWDDIDALQIGVALHRTGGAARAQCTQVYVEVDYTAVTPKTSSDTGSGIDAYVSLEKGEVKSSSDTGSGAEGTPVPSALLASSETGSGIEAIIARLLSAVDTGGGVEAGGVEVGSLLQDLFASELGWGSDSLIAKIEMPTKGGGMKLWT